MNDNPSLQARTKGQKAAHRGRSRGGEAARKRVSAIKKLTIDQVAEIATTLVMGGIPELKNIRKDPEATVLQVWFSSVVAKGITTGDGRSLDVILDRIIGKPKANITVSGNPDGAPIQVSAYDGWSAEKLVAEAERLRLQRLATGG